MTTPVVPLHCAECQGANPQDNKFCQHCKTPLLRRYLWVIGEGIQAYTVGDLISDRYWLFSPHIVLDTQPFLPPQFPRDIPDSVAPYLTLFPQRLHIPQLFGQLSDPLEDIWLLEYGTSLNPRLFVQGQILPPLNSVWAQADPLRQLNWLWQMANLWQPLQSAGVASSLTDPSLLRVQGAILKILELQRDRETVSLRQLGLLWSQWIPGASPIIQPFLRQLCQQLATEKITTADQLVDLLDYALAQCAPTLDRTYDVCAQTDTGSLRHHNEDACHPNSGDCQSFLAGEHALAIVCDGIGGHDGGEIASNLAIDRLKTTVQAFSQSQEELSPQVVSETLENAILDANDQISQRNDSEKRQQRQRMGTTLVMTVAQQHQMYLAHVGDSRIYWINREGCHQVTLDDDVASREVRLGYALYRDAVSFPSGGALVQALGMNSSSRLYPTIDRVILDDDGVFLLCSDGLSDNDRVEQYWETEILPILTQGKPVGEAVHRLMTLANEKNGHDNITVALVHCQVQPQANSTTPQIDFPEEKLAALTAASPATELSNAPTTSPKLEKRSSRKPSLFLLSLLIVVGLLAGITVLSFFLFPSLRYEANRLLGNTKVTSTAQNTGTEATPTASVRLDWETVDVNQYLQIQEAITLQSTPNPETSETFSLPARSILKVTEKQTTANQTQWLQLEQCLPTVTDSPETTAGGPTLPPPPPPSLDKSNPDKERPASLGWLSLDANPDVKITLLSADDVQCE
ncbi:protein phosphatase 2C domain-containing protein [Spirulina sp. CS-785/01]|uniref:protein phosphatase 2C domain-containing protein n=1 Tax=Spirulina sp. CS-785/01 TaxID=3021716 RepID=UPI00232B80CB|nr:protein phosphatase 2C domain-containing protein [Spirulina sp. CS-785/01]MDB9314549.1 protein phosphatase 2C domain-containing protein [Spirulina sp. CS-785/01]